MVQKIRKPMPKPKQNKLDRNLKPKLKEFVKRKPKGKVQPKQNNQYVFEGFFERLKSIDVKQTHSSLNELNFRMDHMATDSQG
jgi:hypothetical protein